KHGKKILRQIIDDAESTLGPAKRNQILPVNIALDETRVLDYLTEFHVVDDFHAQSAIRADCFVDGSPDHVKSAHAHVVARFGIGNFPWPVSENKKHLEKRDHHSLAYALHDHAREKNEMVGSLRLGISNGAPQNVGLEEYIGVGEEHPLSCRLWPAVHIACVFPNQPEGSSEMWITFSRVGRTLLSASLCAITAAWCSRSFEATSSMICPVRSVERSLTAMIS